MSRLGTTYAESVKNSLLGKKQAWKVQEDVSEANTEGRENPSAMKRYDLASGALWNMGG